MEPEKRNLRFKTKIYLTVLVFLSLFGIAGYCYIETKLPSTLPKKEIIKNDTVKLDSFSESNMNSLMYTLDIKHPDIVMNQAKLETGHFTSPRFKNYNALFGFQISDKNVIKYKTWKESVIHYKFFQMRKLKEGENYYNFLLRVKYAKDTLYIKKLKSMEHVQSNRK